MTTNPDKLRAELPVAQQAENDYLASVGRPINATEIKLFNATDKIKYPKYTDSKSAIPGSCSFELLNKSKWDDAYENTTAKTSIAEFIQKDGKIRKLQDALDRSVEEVAADELC